MSGWCNTDAAKQRRAAAEIQCMEHCGSQIPLYVHMLRELNSCLHGTFSGLIRNEHEPEHENIHIMYREEGDSLVFDIKAQLHTILLGRYFITTNLIGHNVIH